MKRRRPYAWLQQHSSERMNLVGSIQYNWRWLFREADDCGHYAQWQLDERDGCHYMWDRVQGYIEEVEFDIFLWVFPLELWFAKTIYQLALERTNLKFPGWNEHHFEDGPLIGERNLVFDSDNYWVAWKGLGELLWHLTEKEQHEVSPSISVQPCSSWGYTDIQAKYARWTQMIDDQHRLVTMVLDTPSVKQELVEKIRDSFEKGEGWEMGSEPRSYSWADIGDAFVELSTPEIALLN